MTSEEKRFRSNLRKVVQQNLAGKRWAYLMWFNMPIKALCCATPRVLSETRPGRTSLADYLAQAGLFVSDVKVGVK